MAFVLDVNLRIKEILGLQKVEAALSQVKGSAATGTAVVGGAGAGGAAAGIKAQATAAATLTAATNNTTVANNRLSASQTKVAASTRTAAAGMTSAATKADSFGASVKIAGQRYAAFLAATVVPFAVLGGLAKATASVIEFDAAMLKITQVMGRTIPQMAGMRDIILDLAANTGTSAAELARVAQVLAQAGQRGDQLTESLTALSKVPLTPSFETMDAAIQGSIAALNQFKREGLSTTEVLDVLTAVSNKFAASSEDIAKGISRGGAAFEAIGGTFREFVGIFTAIRQATRESAETVGTFMKTISSRLADPKIVNFLEGKGIRISEAIESGNPVEAIKRIASALQNTASIQDRIEIGTKLGGRRQISRLLALVSNIDVMNDALNTANGSAGEFGKVAEQGLQSLQAQLNILVQEMNRLVQSLAQPLFVPLIRGATKLGQAFVFFIDVIKPVIPALTTIIGFAAGFKLLAISIGAASKAMAFMSTVGIGGGIPGVLNALSGAGAGGVAGAAARGRIQSRVAGGLGVGLVSGTGLGAGGAVAGGIGGALARSSIGQLAGAAGLILVADKLSSAFEGAGDSTGVMASEFVKAASVIAISASLLSGKSISGAIGSFIGFMTPWGAAIGAGIAALGAFTFAATKAVDLDVQSILDAAAKKVSEIKVLDIKAGDIGALQGATGELGSGALGGVEESAIRFEEGFSGLMSSVVARISNVFSGEGLVTISESQAQQMMQDIIGDNPDLLNEVIRSSIEQFGAAGLEVGLDKLLTQAFSGNVEAANRVRIAMIAQAGGIIEISKNIKKQKVAAEVSKLADAMEKASKSFQTLNVPSQLSGQLRLLSDAVGSAAKLIQLNVRTFDKISQNIGTGIGIARPEADFQAEDVQRVAAAGGLGEFFDISKFAELEGFGKNFFEIASSLDSFMDSIIADKARADSLLSAFTTPEVDPIEVFEDYIKEWEKTLPTDLPPEAREVFVASAKKSIESIKAAFADGGLLPDSDAAAKALESVLGGQTKFADATIEVFTRWLNAQAEGAALNISAHEFKARINIDTSNLAQTLAFSLGKSLEGIGIDTGGLGDFTRGIDGAQRAIVEFGTDSELMKIVLDRLLTSTGKYLEVLRKSDEFTLNNGVASGKLTDKLAEMGPPLVRLQEAFELLKKTAQAAPAAFGEIDSRRQAAGLGADTERAARVGRVSEQIVEGATRRRRLGEADLAIKSSQAFVKPAEFFAKALLKSTASLESFASALTAEDLSRGLSGLNVRTTEEGRIFTERKVVPGAAASPQQQALDRNTAQSVVFGARMDIVLNTMRQVASSLASDRAIKQGFGRGGGDFEAAAASRELAKKIENINLLSDIPKIIGESGLDAGEVARGTSAALKELFERLTAQGESPRQLDFLGVLNRNMADLSSSLQTLIQFPSVGGQPEKLVPGLSQELQNAIRDLTPVAPSIQESTTPRSFERISSSADDIQQAAIGIKTAADATSLSIEVIRAASTDVKQGGADMILASQGMANSAIQMRVVADVQRETATSQQNASVAVVEGEGSREAATKTTEAVNALGERVDAITNAIGIQTQQAAELATGDEGEALAIEGLSENTDVISTSNEVASKTQESMSELGDEMTKIASAMEEGVGIDIETMSEVKVDVQGVARAAREFTAEFEAVAERVVKEQIRVVLEQLASASGNSELAKTFESVV